VPARVLAPAASRPRAPQATHGARAAWLAVALSQELRGLSRLIAGAAQASARTALAAGRATGGAGGVQDGGVALALAAGRTPVEWQRASWPIARLSAWIEQLRGSLDQVCALLFVPCSLCPALCALLFVPCSLCLAFCALLTPPPLTFKLRAP